MCGVYVVCVYVFVGCGGSVGECCMHVYVSCICGVYMCMSVYKCVDGVVCIYVVWDVCMYLWCMLGFIWGVYVNGGYRCAGGTRARVCELVLEAEQSCS